jgi:hypothetical protein
MASIMGESGDIFFPKLDEERDMIPFDRIALDLLKELGLEADICKTEEEAKEKAIRRRSEEAKGRPGEETLHRSLAPSLSHSSAKNWPVFFFGSDTSGEKSFEEFYTEHEVLDNESFINLGVVKNSKKRSIEEIDSIFDQLRQLFESKEVTKAAIVDILKVYLPNFDHIETGKGLDSKM